jgi:hypothetical protein
MPIRFIPRAWRSNWRSGNGPVRRCGGRCGGARRCRAAQERRHLYRATGLPTEEADAQAFLFYCFIFGQSLLFLERGPRKRAQLIAKSAKKLFDHES